MAVFKTPLCSKTFLQFFVLLPVIIVGHSPGSQCLVAGILKQKEDLLLLLLMRMQCKLMNMVMKGMSDITVLRMFIFLGKMLCTPFGPFAVYLLSGSE